MRISFSQVRVVFVFHGKSLPCRSESSSFPTVNLLLGNLYSFLCFFFTANLFLAVYSCSDFNKSWTRVLPVSRESLLRRSESSFRGCSSLLHGEFRLRMSETLTLEGSPLLHSKSCFAGRSRIVSSALLFLTARRSSHVGVV